MWFWFGFACGFVVGAMLFGLLWRKARHKVDELEALLSMRVRELLKR